MANTRQGGARSAAPDFASSMVFIGLGLCVAALINLIAFSGRYLGIEEALAEKVLIVGAMALMFLVFYGLADRFSTLRGELAACIIGVIGVAAYIVGVFVFGDTYAAMVVCKCVAAAGVVALATSWFTGLCLEPRKMPHAYIAAAIGIGLVVCVGECFFTPQVREIAFVLTLAISAVLAFVQWRHHSKAKLEVPRVDSKKADARSRIQHESVIMLAVIHAQVGFLAGTSYIDLGRATPFMLAAAIATCIILAVDALAKKPRITEESIHPVTIPLTITGFVGMYLFGDGVVHIVALCLLSILGTIYIVSGMVAINKHVTLAALSPVRTFGRAHSIDYCAMVGGVALGFLAGWGYGEDAIIGIQVTSITAIGYAFVASFFHKARFPDSTVKYDGSDGFAPVREKGQWKRRCYEVSERFGLSERQTEVLFLIGQGRNAEYVANSLTISVSTVQTHIRNIYQKLGVHSRQELLDLIENTKLYGED